MLLLDWSDFFLSRFDCEAESTLGPKKVDFLGGHVRRNINLLGKLGDLDLEASLDRLENLGVLLVSNKGNGQTLGTETTGTTDTMEVGIGGIWDIVVDDNVHTGDIETTGEDIGGDEDTLVELLERFVAGDTLLLGHGAVNANTGEVALDQQLVELVGALDRLDKDADLVELERIQEVVQLAVLLVLGDSDKVLLKTVEGQLCLVIDVNLERVLHELLADETDLLVQGGREHHDLLVVGSLTENALDITAHVCNNDRKGTVSEKTLRNNKCHPPTAISLHIDQSLSSMGQH